MNKLISTKNRVFILLNDPSKTGKSLRFYDCLKNTTFQPNFDSFFYQHSRPFYDIMQKGIKNLQFVRGVNSEIIDSLKNNGTKCWLTFENPCEDICNSKAIIDIATAWSYHGLSTF